MGWRFVTLLRNNLKQYVMTLEHICILHINKTLVYSADSVTTTLCAINLSVLELKLKTLAKTKESEMRDQMASTVPTVQR